MNALAAIAQLVQAASVRLRIQPTRSDCETAGGSSAGSQLMMRPERTGNHYVQGAAVER
jgi:hypothetical protein